MVSGSVTAPAGEGVAPLNFIYACSVCCYTLADVYEGHNETVEGLSDGINPKDRLVTHLYLASCCHVFCGSHLEGGAPPFHPEGQRPSAPCPTCIKEKNDSSPRDLFSIRGFQKDEYDPVIPSTWFVSPPNFNEIGKDIEALKFQYLALVRYCQSTHATRKPLQNALMKVQKQLAAQNEVSSQERAKAYTLEQENERLKSLERKHDSVKAELAQLQDFQSKVEQYRGVNPKDLETYIKHKKEIRHHLGMIPQLVEQNIKMKQRLASLGFAMHDPIPNLKDFDFAILDDDGGIDGDHYGTSGPAVRNIGSSHTAGRSAGRSARATSNPFTVPSNPFGQRPLKRQRIESPLPNNMQTEQRSSRDAMPPPQKPVSRMRSMRKIIPTLRKKFSSGRSTGVPEPSRHREEDIQMHEGGNWNGVSQASANGIQASIHRNDVGSESHYMSGALPVSSLSQSSSHRGPKLLSSVGVDSHDTGFTFRAPSPVKMNHMDSGLQPVQLPSEPSYIRLMDGLSHDSGFELGLKDPRDSVPRTHHVAEEHRQVLGGVQGFREYEESGIQEDWSRGLPFQHHSERGLSFASGSSLEPSELRTDRHHDRPHHNPVQDPITPAPRRYPQSGQQIESVVSPIVEGISRNTSQFLHPRVAEPQHSSNRSADYRSRAFPRFEPVPQWSEPNGLNSLSFFNSPVISERRVQRDSQEHQQYNSAPPSKRYHTRNLNSSGFITRPEAERSPFFRDSAYGSSRDRPTHFEYQQTAPNAAIPFPSFPRSQSLRTGQIPSHMPSIVSSRSPVRREPHWKTLQQVGLRSSQQNFGRTAGNGLSHPARNIESRARRRNVRR